MKSESKNNNIYINHGENEFNGNYYERNMALNDEENNRKIKNKLILRQKNNINNNYH